MGAALMAFLGAELKSGIEIVTQALNLEEHIHDCTWVLTGEGRIDSQSINGKVPVGVASVAKKYHKPVDRDCRKSDAGCGCGASVRQSTRCSAY
ncbi:glycerate kinase [Enterobacter hormaechei]|uniref:glycerate kinase n=1 Tax=Enterobacter hormaechei TaxID=158836 RepID=UPI003D24DF27